MPRTSSVVGLNPCPALCVWDGCGFESLPCFVCVERHPVQGVFQPYAAWNGPQVPMLGRWMDEIYVTTTLYRISTFGRWMDVLLVVMFD